MLIRKLDSLQSLLPKILQRREGMKRTQEGKDNYSVDERVRAKDVNLPKLKTTWCIVGLNVKTNQFYVKKMYDYLFLFHVL